MEKHLHQQKSNCIKIVLFGPESTGKSSLAKFLASHYKTHYVEEYARQYLQEKWDKSGKVCEKKDIIPIAKGQIKNENILLKEPFEGLFTQGMVCHETYKDKNNKWLSPEEVISTDGKNYYNKNILCFGDNIHKVHPLAGQGFNLVLRDIKKLNEKTTLLIGSIGSDTFCVAIFSATI